MKKSVKIIPFFMLLLGILSCSKAPELSSEQSNTNPKQVAQTSSIINYSKDNTTTVTTIETSPGNNQKEVLYSIGPLTVQEADVISAHFQQQLTWSGSLYNTLVGRGIIIATNATATSSSSPGYIAHLVKFSASNLSGQQEDWVETISHSGSYQFQSNASNIYINAVVYAESSNPTVPDLDLPAGDYGELVTVVERGVTRYSQNTYNLPVNGSGRYYVPLGGALYVRSSIGPINIPAGSMVDARFEVEATTDIPSALKTDNQRLGRKVIQGNSNTATTGTVLTRAIQQGITWAEHHNTQSHVGGEAYSSAVNGAYINSLVYAYGSWTGAPLYIEKETSSSYGHMIVEVRPNNGFYEDLTRNATFVDATKRVLYSVGPIDIDANQVVEVRYQASFNPSSAHNVGTSIVRATSPTSITGVVVQRPLQRQIHPDYIYGNVCHSTAERPSTAQTGQYYNVVGYASGNVTVMDTGELEVVKR